MSRPTLNSADQRRTTHDGCRTRRDDRRGRHRVDHRGLIGAIFLRLAASWIAKEDIPYGSAFGTVVIATILNYAIGFAVGFLAAGAGATEESFPLIQLAMLPVGILIQSAVISARHAISFGKSLLISLVMMAIMFVIVLIVVVVVMVAMGSMA